MDGGTKRTGNQKLTPRRIETWLARHRAGKVKAHAKLSDGDGMYLTVTKAGTAVWRVKYRHGGVESTYSIGPYGKEPPAITLAAARTEREQVRAHLRAGRNPLQARDVERAASVAASGATFEVVARDWLKKQKKQWSATHYEKSERAIERDVLPKIGDLPVSEIRPVMVTHVIESIVGRGAADTASKVLEHVGAIFRLAQARGLCNYTENPAISVRAVLPKRAQQRRRPALLRWSELGEVLRKAETARLSPAVRLASRLCAFTAVRISNVVEAEWKEFQLDAEPPLWVIPRTKMKAKDRIHDHKVILGATIASELREWRRLTSRRGYVFPSDAGAGHITREALEKVYRITLGLEDKHTPHGWRAAFSTLARDKGEERDKHGNVVSAAFERDVVELALDHIHDNDVVRAYDRGERLQERIRLMNWWDGELVRAQHGADVIPLAVKRA